MVATLSVRILRNDLGRLQRAAPGKAEIALEALAREGERYVKQSFGTSPSSPGDPPGVDTGALRASIHVEAPAPNKRIIADGMEYGIHLEFGTRFMAARPFMGPMVMWLRGQVTPIFDEFLT